MTMLIRGLHRPSDALTCGDRVFSTHGQPDFAGRAGGTFLRCGRGM
jgi:hypothetical protein